MAEIIKNGEFLKINKAGFLENDLKIENIKHPWNLLVEDLITACKENNKSNLHSIYLRGSVASGKAIENASDLDSFIVVFNINRNNDWINQFIYSNLKKYNFCLDIEISVIELCKLMDLENNDFASVRFYLKNLSLCLFGENLK